MVAFVSDYNPNRLLYTIVIIVVGERHIWEKIYWIDCVGCAEAVAILGVLSLIW